jgi:hypothetical protein
MHDTGCREDREVRGQGTGDRVENQFPVPSSQFTGAKQLSVSS